MARGIVFALLAFLLSAVVFALGAAGPVSAHTGGLNHCGCDHDRSTGECPSDHDYGCGCASEPDRCEE